MHLLLNRVAKEHPQGLVYPLTVAAKSQSQLRQSAALRVLSEMRKQCDHLVEQASLVSIELIRTSILWHEMWHTALEEASRMFFGAQDVEGMLSVLGELPALPCNSLVHTRPPMMSTLSSSSGSSFRLLAPLSQPLGLTYFGNSPRL